MRLRKNAKILGRVVNALFAATCLLAHGAWATEITWKGSTGGDIEAIVQARSTALISCFPRGPTTFA